MRNPLLAVVLVAATAACSALSGLDDFGVDGASGGTGGAATSDGGSAAPGGSMVGGLGGTGGMSSGPVCGDGVIDPGEQCDAGPDPSPFCSPACEVTGCDGPHNHLRGATGHCYRYSDTDGQIGSWDQAQAFCSSWGGELLVLDDAAERDFIISLLAALMWKNEYFWVGAHDMDGDAAYTWIDGSMLPTGSPWWESQPFAGGCVAMYPDGELRVSGNCSGTDLPGPHLHFACERAPVDG